MINEVDEIGIRGIPRESKLLVLGDWFQTGGAAWKVVCYFHNHKRGYFRRALPIDLLPALVPGIVFPRSSTENKAQGWTETIKLPSQENWNKQTFKLTFRTHFKNKFFDIFRLSNQQWFDCAAACLPLWADYLANT